MFPGVSAELVELFVQIIEVKSAGADYCDKNGGVVEASHASSLEQNTVP